MWVKCMFYLQFDKFINTVNRNLVDSNMFIRSLVLSLEHLMNEETAFMGKTLANYKQLKSLSVLLYILLLFKRETVLENFSEVSF